VGRRKFEAMSSTVIFASRRVPNYFMEFNFSDCGKRSCVEEKLKSDCIMSLGHSFECLFHP
jgi:hypothetical protein